MGRAGAAFVTRWNDATGAPAASCADVAIAKGGIAVIVEITGRAVAAVGFRDALGALTFEARPAHPGLVATGASHFERPAALVIDATGPLHTKSAVVAGFSERKEWRASPAISCPERGRFVGHGAIAVSLACRALVQAVQTGVAEAWGVRSWCEELLEVECAAISPPREVARAGERVG